MEIQTIKKIVSSTKNIIKHHNELAKLKGENFNVFSILKMESKENETHSAFLGELLNPEGSHYKGTVFLDLFLKTIGDTTIDLGSAKLILEKHIGARNDDKATGGRVDIFIGDDKNNTLCIENKIYAPDQNVQIQRYVNYNMTKNIVYYLTLYGYDANEESRGELKENTDYFCISYSQTIMDWLDQCLKEAAEYPILRESIKQYIILIKKLTNQLTNNAMEQELKTIITNNYAEVKHLEASIWDVELEMATLFLQELNLVLKEKLNPDWSIEMDSDLEKSWKGIRLRHKDWYNGIEIKLEGQSKIPWNDSVYGVKYFDSDLKKSDVIAKLSQIELLQNGFRGSNHWSHYKTLLWFSSTENRKMLFIKEKRNPLVKETASAIIELAELCKIPLIKDK